MVLLELNKFILDVDGVLTDGTFYYDEHGKQYKKFGAHDSDGLKLLKRAIPDIRFISADHRGFEISKRRITDMGYSIDLVPEKQRYGYLERLGFDKMIFMADGVYDAKCLKTVALGIAPNNAVDFAKESANYITLSTGGDGAVYEACMYVLFKFFPNIYMEILNELT